MNRHTDSSDTGTTPAQLPAAVLAEAEAWYARLTSERATLDDWQAWERWRAASPDHELVWLQVEARARAAKAQASTPEPAVARRMSRRQAVSALGVLLLAGTAGVGAYRHEAWRHWLADYRTDVGERRVVTLDDDTRILLNSDTSLDVRYDNAQRLVRLHRGEIMIVTGHGDGAAGRPFRVATAQGQILALGTRLNVRQLDGLTQVSVFQHAAEIQPAQTLAMRRLEAGEGVRFSLHAIGEVERVSEQRQAAWTEGVLHAEHMPLSELLAELGRYRRGHLSCDPALADLPVSGTFTLDDTDRILAALASELPLEVNHVTRYWVVLRPGRSARPA